MTGGTSRLALGRKLWLKVHRYIGLFLGALFVLVGLTGSILAFWQPIDEWLNADVMRVEVPAQAIYPPARRDFCRRQGSRAAWRRANYLAMPRHSGAAVSVSYDVPAAGEKKDYYEIFVDPYSGMATGQRLIKRGDCEFSMFVPLILYVTGFMRWRQKRRGRLQRRGA